MMHAYNRLYLNKSSRTLGYMLHEAVYEYGLNGKEFLDFFVSSGIAKEFEEGNPKYIAGMSGLELFLEVMEKSTTKIYEAKEIEIIDKSPAFWTGWALAKYQWYSSKSFKDILEILPYDEFVLLYFPYHEADISKIYEIIDERFLKAPAKLKRFREEKGLTQQELATTSGVSLNTIRAYERKSKNIGKAQYDILLKLIKALGCSFEDII